MESICISGKRYQVHWYVSLLCMYVYVCNLERGWVGMCIMMQVSRVRGDGCFYISTQICLWRPKEEVTNPRLATLLIFRIISLREPIAHWFCQAVSQRLLPISGFFYLKPSLLPPALSLSVPLYSSSLHAELVSYVSAGHSTSVPHHPYSTEQSPQHQPCEL